MGSHFILITKEMKKEKKNKMDSNRLQQTIQSNPIHAYNNKNKSM